MTLPVNTGDRERDKFVETLNGDVALRILLSNDHDLKIDEHGDMPIIDMAHYMIHEGKGYMISDYDSDTDTGAIKIWHIRTPDTTVEIHMIYSLSVSNSGYFEIQEAPTISNNGTSLQIINNDRNLSNTSTLTAFADPTVSATGAGLIRELVGSSNPGARIGGQMKHGSEFILKRNTSYIFRFTPDNDNTKATLNLEYYENND